MDINKSIDALSNYVSTPVSELTTATNGSLDRGDSDITFKGIPINTWYMTDEFKNSINNIIEPKSFDVVYFGYDQLTKSFIISFNMEDSVINTVIFNLNQSKVMNLRSIDELTGKFDKSSYETLHNKFNNLIDISTEVL